MTLTSTQYVETPTFNNPSMRDDVQAPDAFASELVAQNSQNGAVSSPAQAGQRLVATPLEQVAPFLSNYSLGIEGTQPSISSERQQMRLDIIKAGKTIEDINDRSRMLTSLEHWGDGSVALKKDRESRVEKVIHDLKSKYSEDDIKTEMGSLFKAVRKEKNAAEELVDTFLEGRTINQFPPSWQKYIGDLKKMSGDGSDIEKRLVTLAMSMKMDVQKMVN